VRSVPVRLVRLRSTGRARRLVSLDRDYYALFMAAPTAASWDWRGPLVTLLAAAFGAAVAFIGVVVTTHSQAEEDLKSARQVAYTRLLGDMDGLAKFMPPDKSKIDDALAGKLAGKLDTGLQTLLNDKATVQLIGGGQTRNAVGPPIIDLSNGVYDSMSQYCAVRPQSTLLSCLNQDKKQTSDRVQYNNDLGVLMTQMQKDLDIS
jgi:hypothetical protein